MEDHGWLARKCLKARSHNVLTNLWPCIEFVYNSNVVDEEPLALVLTAMKRATEAGTLADGVSDAVGDRHSSNSIVLYIIPVI